MSLLSTFSNPSMLHAAVVHLPVALAVLGVPLIYGCAVYRGERHGLRWMAIICYLLTAVTGYAAVFSGEGAMDRVPAEMSREIWDLINRHEDMGEKVWVLATAIAVLLGLGFINQRGVRQFTTAFAMIASLAMAGWVGLTAHFGGHLVYEYSVGTPAMFAKEVSPAPADPASPTQPGESDPAPASVMPAAVFTPEEAAQVSYTRDVVPILNGYCYECHNPDKTRGDFDCTSVLAIIDGGKKAGPGLVAGDPEASSIIKYIRGDLQPQMPKGEDPLTPEELRIITMWIAAGAIDDSVPAAPVQAEAEPPAEAGA